MLMAPIAMASASTNVARASCQRTTVISASEATLTPSSIDPATGERRISGTSGPLIATFCHPYTLKSFLRAVRRAFGGSAKRSPRVTRRQLAEEAAAAGLRLERIVPVMPLLSEVWVVVLRTPPATS